MNDIVLVSSISLLNSSEAAVVHRCLSLPFVRLVYEALVGFVASVVSEARSSRSGVVFVRLRCFRVDASRRLVVA